ncbi:unnamed protein product [Klebsiella pneumoniae]|nr:unnamed protein product [Klebsiella pneumoniae]
MAIETLAARTGATPLRIRRVQKITLTLLFIAGIVNFLDRSSLSVAGEAIRADLGLSATEFGVLLSAFSLSYGFAQLPSGILLDRLVTRLFAGAAGVKPGPYRLGGGDPVSCRGGGDVGQRPGGRCPGAQRLRSGENPQNGDCYRSGAVGAGYLAGGAIVDASPGGGFYLHGAVLRSFCRDVRLGAGAGNGGGA